MSITYLIEGACDLYTEIETAALRATRDQIAREGYPALACIIPDQFIDLEGMLEEHARIISAVAGLPAAARRGVAKEMATLRKVVAAGRRLDRILHADAPTSGRRPRPSEVARLGTSLENIKKALL